MSGRVTCAIIAIKLSGTRFRNQKLLDKKAELGTQRLHDGCYISGFDETNGAAVTIWFISLSFYFKLNINVLKMKTTFACDKSRKCQKLNLRLSLCQFMPVGDIN